MVGDVTGILRTAASHLESAATMAEHAETIKLPNLLFRGHATQKIHAAYAAATAEAMRGVHALEPLGAPLEDARAGVLAQLREIDPSFQYAIERQREYTAAQDVPGMLRVHADRLRLQADLVPLEPAAARAELQNELDTILRMPLRDVTHEQQWRAGVIVGMPTHLRPSLPDPVRSNYPLDVSAVRSWTPHQESMTRGEWHNLQLDLQRRELAATPGVTRASLDAEVRSIIATPYPEVTRELNDRLSVIAGMPDELRPALMDTPMPWPQHRLEHLASWNWLPDSSQDARAKYDALRMAVEHEQAIADPTFTREVASRELLDIVSLPNELITPDDFRRTSWLLRLPESHRPDVGSLPRVPHGLENLGLFGYHPTTNKASAAAIDLLRAHLAATVDPERAAAQLRARVEAGEQIDIRLVTALASHGDLLERAGLTDDVLHRQAMRVLAGPGGMSTESLALNLERARAKVARASSTDPAVLAMRDQALEIADRNLDRIAGRRTDTFGRHPDYAEIGQFVSISDLLDALGSSTSSAAKGAESLSW
jgi:hypothetical protein